MKIAIRVDGNAQLGMGNIYRSLALAQALQEQGHQVVFIMKGHIESLELVRDKGYTVFLLSPGSCNGSLNAQIEAIVQEAGLKLVVNDVKDTDGAYMRTLKNLALTVVNFDDLGEGRNQADLIFDAFHSQWENPSLPAEHLGLPYMVLRDEFEKSLIPGRKVGRNIQSIVVMMGGANTGNHLRNILVALAQLPRHIQMHVILGKAIANAERFQMDFDRPNFTYHYQPDHIALLFAGADLAITSGGVSMCETCAAGIPTLVIPQVAHELENSALLSLKGAIVALPFNPEGLPPELILENLRALMQHPGKRRTLQQNACEAVDGKGLDRILSVLQPYLHLAPAN